MVILTACGGGTPEPTTVNNGAGTDDLCDENPYGATCGTEFETQRQTIISECTTDDAGDLCTEATTFACTDNFFHELCNDIMEYEDKRTEFNKTCTNTKSQEVCDAEALVRNCAANPFMDTCGADMGAIALRESRCLADRTIDPTCIGEAGIATLFCEANPFNSATACGHEDHDDERATACLADIMEDDRCTGAQGIVAVFCEANPFDTATPCTHGDYDDDRNTACLADITINPLCRGTTGIVTAFCKDNPFDSAPACGHSDFNDDREMACESGVKTRPDCQPTIARICTNGNFFEDFCTGLPGVTERRIANCIQGSNAVSRACGNVFPGTPSNGCTVNPFSDICKASDSPFAAYADMARTNRLRHCETTQNNTLCTSTNRANVCGYDPFNAICYTGTTYAMPRETACLAESTIDPSCTTADTGIIPMYCDRINDLSFRCATDKTASESEVIRLKLCTGLDIETTDDITATQCASVFLETTTRTQVQADAANACVLNPFAPACDAYLYINAANSLKVRNQRKEFCTDSSAPANAQTAQCSAYNACTSNPFGAGCGVYFDMARTERQAACVGPMVHVASATRGLCAAAKVAGICEFDPFNIICFTGSNTATYKLARSERVASCRMSANSALPICANVANCNGNTHCDAPTTTPVVDPNADTVNGRDWTAHANVYAGDRTGGAVASRDTATRTHQFVQIVDPALLSTDAHVFVLRMATNTANGMAFFEEAGTGYAGIFTDTDVGAPIAVTETFIDADVVAVWPAKMRAIRIFTGPSFGDGASNTGELGFNLTVNFTQRTLRGIRRDPVTPQRRISILGSFLSADNGVITGTVQTLLHSNVSFTRHGYLTGIIGAEGVVAAFIYANGGQNGHFAGGFVAVPPAAPQTATLDGVVTYRDWAELANPVEAANRVSPSNQFLQTNVAKNFGVSHLIDSTQVEARVISFATGDPGGDGNDGARIASFRHTQNGSLFYYSGIWASTHLGAPLAQATGTAKWKGYIRSVGLSATDTPFIFDVDFARKHIEAFVQSGCDLAVLSPCVKNKATNYWIRGQYNDRGIIFARTTGVPAVIHASFIEDYITTVDGGYREGDRNQIITDGQEQGVLTGLIGSYGAIGVFHSNATGAGGYSGAFIARPSISDSRVDYYDWLNVTKPDSAVNETPQNQFLQITGRTSRELEFETFGATQKDMSKLDMTSLGAGGSASNGVQFTQGAHGGTGDVFNYAGILSTTNVGAVLGIPAAVPDQKVTWNGRIQTIGYALTAVTDGPDFKVFTLEVDFAKKHIEAFVQSGVPLNRNGVERDTHYWIRGKYDDRGVITARDNIPGVVHARFNGALAGGVYTGERTFITYADDRQVEGTLTGLIGTAGAVGAFYSTDRSTAPDVATAGDSYVGGFVAKP